MEPLIPSRQISSSTCPDSAPLTVQPAVNLDPTTIDDSEWFLCYFSDKLFYNKLKWVNGFTAPPVWQYLGPWPWLAIPQPFYTLENGGVTAPQLGNTSRVDLPRQGSRLMMAVTRKIGDVQYLWTCHQ